jgi:hypothetical protein
VEPEPDEEVLPELEPVLEELFWLLLFLCLCFLVVVVPD